MTIRTKKAIAVTIAWLAFLALLGIVGGVERGWMPLSAMWWSISCLLGWGFGLWKAGWLRA